MHHFKVNEKVWFKDRSWGQAFTIKKVDGNQIYFNGEHGKLSSPVLASWLQYEEPKKPEEEEKSNDS